MLVQSVGPGLKVRASLLNIVFKFLNDGCRYQSCTDVVGLASVPSSGCEKELEPSLRTFNARSRSRLGPDCGSTGGFMSTELQLHKVLVLDQRSEEPGSRCGLG